MKYPRFLLVLSCATASFTCVSQSADDPDTGDPSAVDAVARWNGGSNDPNGETIRVEGTAPGEGWHVGWWFPGPGDEGQVNPPPGGGGGGGGGPGGTGKPPRPARRNCQEELDEHGDRERCRLDCCAWNHDKVDAPSAGGVITAITGAP